MNEVESRWGEWPNLLLTLAIVGVALFFKSIEMPTVAFWIGMLALVIFVEYHLKRAWRKTIRPAIIADP